MKLALRVPPLGVMALAALLGWLCARALPALNGAGTLTVWLAPILLALGVVCSLLGVASFRRAGTTVNPLNLSGTNALVVSGIYRITRNPMYLGFLLILLAEIAWLANPAGLIAAPAFVLYLNSFQIGPEERALQERFGPDYAAYAARVRRWI